MHATISPINAILCAVAFDYDETAKDAVKHLAGTSYAGGAWRVPILHLPTLKTIFGTMTVDPAVVGAYHELLRRMLDDLASSAHRKGNLGAHITELMERHAIGIAHIKAQTKADDPQLSLWLRGVKNAHANAERKAAIVRKRKEAAWTQ